MFRTLAARVLEVLFPPMCIACHAALASGVLCTNCFARIALANTLFCGACRSRFGEHKKTCHPGFPYRLGAPLSYHDEVVQALIYGLKFDGVRLAAVPLATLMNRYLASLPFSFQTYTAIPIPLGSARLRERGFNQSELLAREVAAHFALPLRADALIRVRNTKPQSALTHAARRENVRGCFVVRDRDAVQGRNILLIDDVVTSGSTLLEATAALKAAGARRVIALVAAKA